MPSSPEAGLHESSERARAHRRRAGGWVDAGGRRVRGRVQPAERLPGSGRPGHPLPGGRTSPGRLGAAAAHSPASPGRPGMGVAGRAGRHRAGRVQRAADSGHPGGQSRQCRGRHRSGPAGHRHRRRSRRGPSPHPPDAARRSRGSHRIRSGPARRHHRNRVERTGAAAGGRGARWRRGHIPAGRTGVAAARRTVRHDPRLRPGRRPAAGRRRRGQLRRRATDPTHTHRDPAGRAVLPRGRGHRRRGPRLVRGHETPRGRPHRAVQRADPHHRTGRRRTDRYGHDHAASGHRSPHRAGRRDPRPRPPWEGRSRALQSGCWPTGCSRCQRMRPLPRRRPAGCRSTAWSPGPRWRRPGGLRSCPSAGCRPGPRRWGCRP